ncbi:MAG: Gfo/Idh/MocA family oxidoreductase [Clostridia bacterium]|nr:Gfo/Idh/MocA family oxidoreductase [Clostridia bacterium]
MNRKIKVILLGAGNRADIYASICFERPELLEVVGIVDPDAVRRELMRKKYSVPSENCFDDVSELVKREKFADAVINGTMDHLHVETSIPVLEKGYDLLLEKPFAVNEAEMNTLVEVARKYGSKVVIGHVLRYTDFYRSIKDRVLAGEIGKIISIETCEHVNYHHMAVSYVRGKWRSEKICFAPMLLAKSCHDIDIMLWMMRETQPVAVASFGSDFQFGAQRKPEGAGERCMVDCPYVDECIFSAKANYLAAPRWKHYVWKSLEGDENLTDEKKARSLMTDNPYGKCVWGFERDGNVDHQTVIINFANGATGTFSMIGGSAKSERNIHIVGTNGEIKGTFEDSRYIVRKMVPSSKSGYEETVYDLNEGGDKIGAMGGHGGGDKKLILDFIDYLNGKELSVSCATLEDSVISHRAVFKAEEARKSESIVKIST